MKLTEELLETIGEEVEDDLELYYEQDNFELNSSISPRIAEYVGDTFTINIGIDWTNTDTGETHEEIYQMQDFTEDDIPDLKEKMVETILDNIRGKFD
jgi:hypothetical protein